MFHEWKVGNKPMKLLGVRNMQNVGQWCSITVLLHGGLIYNFMCMFDQMVFRRCHKILVRAAEKENGYDQTKL